MAHSKMSAVLSRVGRLRLDRLRGGDQRWTQVARESTVADKTIAPILHSKETHLYHYGAVG